ncbi:MAG: bifunctional DNA-formamidopyrimidine glycosylase/DNA-(apurinic or apyrimidinic site) lyase [Chloroflexota bacterium]
MPELPEIETFRRRFLRGDEDTPPLLGRRVTGIDLLWARTLDSPSPEEFEARIVGQSIGDIGRRGKYLLLHLSTDTLAMHLRMSGDLWVEAGAAPVAAHHRLLLNLDGGIRLAFNDTRKFGRVWLLADTETLLGKLGPEPLGDSFTPALFYAGLQTRRRQIKPLLLDQRFLAGMGNIYTDEALHLAGLHPQARSSALTWEQAARLWESIRHVLQEGIRRNGASIDWVYRGGDFQNYFQVYQRTGEPCYKCGTPIERIVVGQRGTHFCPQCQPAFPPLIGSKQNADDMD